MEEDLKIALKYPTFGKNLYTQYNYFKKFIMEKLYVESVESDYRIVGTRVSLESVIIPFLDGLSPEVIASECFPSLSLEQVYGAITFYIAHRSELEANMKHAQKEYDSLRRSINNADPAFSQTINKILRAPHTVQACA